MRASLLLEIGCEEIPARAIPAAATDLRDRIVALLDQAGIAHGSPEAWGGSRRIAVRVASVEERQADRQEEILGPPASAAFDAGGSPTAAALGFARKHGVDPSALERIPTDRGVYCGLRRASVGRTLGELLAAEAPAAVAAMSFPKTMRWGDGRRRWVRPVHWVLALHGTRVLPLDLFDVSAGDTSLGHRFLAPEAVRVTDPSRYLEALRSAFVVVDPGERRATLLSLLRAAAGAAGGELAEDPALLEEVGDLVEWPGVVAGRFDAGYLDLPREILVTTLRHHQKAFSVERGGSLQPVFLSAANTDRDPGGHVRRGHEWVVAGRLEDARFFWNEDRKASLADRLPRLARVVFHRQAGTYAEKTARVERLARSLAGAIGLSPGDQEHAARAAQLAKCDLVTSLVGEFPELQGIAGGLLLREEGAPEAVWRAVYEHYRPAGPEDALPAPGVPSVVSVADKLDTVAEMLKAGEAPTGSRDPYGLRRATNAMLRIILEHRWSLSLWDLYAYGGQVPAFAQFLGERIEHFLRERGSTPHEVRAVLDVSGDTLPAWPIHDVEARLRALRGVRDRADFERLVDLTRRVENIRAKANSELLKQLEGGAEIRSFREKEKAALELDRLLERLQPRIERASSAQEYEGVVTFLAEFVEPVETFFQEVLVLDPENLDATRSRLDLMSKLHAVLTSYFDVTKLRGEASRRG